MKRYKYYMLFFMSILIGGILALVEKEMSLEAKYENQNQTKQAIQNQVTQTLHESKVAVHPTAAYQGDTIFIGTSEGGWIEFKGIRYQLQPYENKYATLVPIALDQAPGDYEISWHPVESMVLGNVTASQENKKVLFSIKKKDFATQYLEVTKEQQEMVYNQKKINEDRAKYTKALSNPIAEPLYSGDFIQPVEGRISTMYGYTRYINGILDSRHRAIDLAAPMGTPILAPNNGKVVLAEELYLSGNRVILDHGGNLQTSFSHLSNLNVSAGDDVKKGEVIGWVGSTGFSTGPHLHHAVYVRGYPVNPEQFFGSDPTQW